MTAYRYFSPRHTTSAHEAKAKRQAVLTRVRKQRAAAYQRTPARETREEMQRGKI